MKFSLKEITDRRPHLALWKSSYSDYVNPLRDWTLGLLIAISTFIGGSLYIAFDFYTQIISPPEITIPVLEQITYKDSEVTRYNELYLEKEKKFEQLRKERTYVPILEMVELHIEDEESIAETEVLADSPIAE